MSIEDENKICQIYKDRLLQTKKEGVVYNVDHIIPLQGILPDGKRVLGAHTPSNLQIMLGCDNYSKGNKITYEDLEKATEGIDYIHVPDDYFDDVWKYPDIGFDVKQKEE